jgi:cation:H+ antiporter
MSAALVVWLQFLACAAVIAVAGIQLSRYGDVIAEKTGVGGGWIGLGLMAAVTSLPELVTSVSAVTIAQAPDIAVGNLLGACVMNLAMIVVLDALNREGSVYSRVSHGHTLAAAFGVAMLALVAGGLVLAAQSPAVPARLGDIGAYTPMLFVVYLYALRTTFRYEQRERRDFVEEMAARYPHVSLRQALVRYAAAALVVVAAALWLPVVADRLATEMAWNRGFVGTLLVALATTLPELTVTVASVRLGALDMAIGNLFGSNLFNLMLIGVNDAVHRGAPLLYAVSAVHAVSAVSAILMSGVAIVGLLYRPPEKVFRAIGWISVVLAAVYLLNAWILYRYGG